MLIRVLLINPRNVAILSSLYNLKVWVLQITKMKNQKLKKVKCNNRNEDLPQKYDGINIF